MEFEEFLDDKKFQNVINDIKSLANLLMHNGEISELCRFSKNFNASIRYFQGENEMAYINDFQYFNPVVLAIAKLAGSSFILYKVESTREPEQLSLSPQVNSDDLKQLLNSLASKSLSLLSNTSQSEAGKEKLNICMKSLSNSGPFKWTFPESS